MYILARTYRKFPQQRYIAAGDSQWNYNSVRENLQDARDFRICLSMETDTRGFRAKMPTCIQGRGNITGLYDTGRYPVGYLKTLYQLQKLSDTNTNIKYTRIL